jgi:hypothetical protein
VLLEPQLVGNRAHSKKSGYSYVSLKTYTQAFVLVDSADRVCGYTLGTVVPVSFIDPPS